MFRRTGSIACYLVEGPMPAPRSPEFRAALARERFTSIEDAASPQSSFGWVSPSDPTGKSFDIEDMEAQGVIWLRARLDRKKLPAPWVAIERAVAERARGRPLTRRERVELAREAEARLLPRVLPAVKLIEALWSPPDRHLLLLASGRTVREEFGKLFHRTFDATVIAADPRAVARALPIGRKAHAYLDEVAPVRWMRKPAVAASTRLEAVAPSPQEASAAEGIA